MLKRVKYKLFLCFLLFSSISLLAVISSVWFYKKKENVSNIVKTLDDIYILSLKDFKLQQDFLNRETINPDFFKTNHSSISDKQKMISEEIAAGFRLLSEQNNIESVNTPESIDSVQMELKRCSEIFEEVKSQLIIRGFQDFGIEGEMRNYAHDLMNLGNEIQQVKILMLRRHEKDFIIRKEETYVSKFNALIEEVKKDIEYNSSIPFARKKEIIAIVGNYHLFFNKLVAVEKSLGIKGQSGLMLQLSKNIDRIQNHFEAQKKFAKQSEKAIYNELYIIAIITAVLIILLAVFLSYFVSSALTKPLISLTNSIKGYVNSDFEHFPSESLESSSYEIETLKINFVKMSEEITSHINYFKEKVEERTKEIQFQKDEILHQKGEIIEQRDQLKIQKEILEIQKKGLVEKNKSMEDSIRYAKRIQKAILPPMNTIKNILPDSFVYYKPKDIVSGDFYWVDQMHSSSSVLEGIGVEHEMHFSNGIKRTGEYVLGSGIQNSESSSKVFFAAVDCTGHGVPGAFMSIVGYNSLNKIVQEYKLTDPAAILNQLNQEVRQTLRQENEITEVKDGMDIALCSLDRSTNILEFAGANNPLYLIRNKELQVIKGDKFPIGLFSEGKTPQFNNHKITVQKGDTIYLFSDGYIDQFGGPKGKKFKQKQFNEVLLSIQDLNMDEQKSVIKNTIEQWQGQSFQVDDMLVIGVKI